MTTQPDLAELIEAARDAEHMGDWDTALVLYETALGSASATGNSIREAELLRWMGRVHYERGALERATELYEASLAKAQETGLRELAASALNCLAAAAQMRGRLDVAEEFYTQAGRIAEQAGNQRLAAGVNQNLGMVAAIRGDTRLALERYQTSVHQLRQLGDTRAASHVLNNIALVYTEQGDFGAAELSFTAAAELATQAGDPRMQGRIEVNRADLYLKRKNYEKARKSCDRASEIFGQLRSDTGMGEAHKLYGVLFRETGQMRRARIELQLALRLSRVCENPLLEAETESEIARVHLHDGRTRQALQSLNRAYHLFEQLDARRDLQDVQRRLEHLEDTYYRALQLLEFESVESQDDHVIGRYERVAELTSNLAKLVGYQGKDLTWLRIGAYLYDVGKASVPAHVLNKPGPLNEEEWKLIREHPVASALIVSELDFPSTLMPLVRNHHERWDGTGYPDGLKGDEIPLEARILCLADAFAALTSDRSFRDAHSNEEALRIMESEAGLVFDPQLFQLFVGLVGGVPRAA